MWNPPAHRQSHEVDLPLPGQPTLALGSHHHSTLPAAVRYNALARRPILSSCLHRVRLRAGRLAGAGNRAGPGFDEIGDSGGILLSAASATSRTPLTSLSSSRRST